MAASRLDLAILKEIVRIVQEKSRVPEKVRILKRDYALVYLEDHRQRMEEALRRFDSDRVNMLFGQLASKVKYQVVRTAKKPVALPQKRAGTPKPGQKAPPSSKVKLAARPARTAPPKRSAAARKATTVTKAKAKKPARAR